MKRFLLIFFTITLGTSTLHSQVSKAVERIVEGRFDVGFEVYNEFDSTRTYRGNPRHLQILTWYPAEPDSLSEFVKLKDYAELSANEITINDTSRSAKERAVNKYVTYYTDFGINNFKFKKELALATSAKHDSKPKKGKFPVVYFVQGRAGSPVENFAMCEYLASYGFVVATIPAYGTNNRGMEFNNSDFRTQLLDQEFVFDFVNNNIVNIDKQKQAYFGYSYGSIVSVLSAMENPFIKGVVSLDGSIGFEDRIKAIEKYSGYDPDKFKVPLLHLNTTERPGRIDLSLIESLASDNKFVVTFSDLKHIDFTSFGILKAYSDVMKSKPSVSYIESQKYLYDYVLIFLDMVLYKSRTNTNRFMNISENRNFPENSIRFKVIK